MIAQEVLGKHKTVTNGNKVSKNMLWFLTNVGRKGQHT